MVGDRRRRRRADGAGDGATPVGIVSAVPIGDENEDHTGDFPSPTERTWIHPAEAARAMGPRSSVVVPPRRRLSAGMIVASAAAGALAMFGTLAATGMVSGFGDSASTVARVASGPTASGQMPSDTAVVSLRMDGPDSMSKAMGLVVDTEGTIVTTADGLDGDTTITVVAGGKSFGGVEVLGSDDATHTTVLRVADAAELTPVVVSDPALGQVRLISSTQEPGSPTTATLANTNDMVSHDGRSLMGTVVISSDAAPHGPAAVVNSAGAAVAVTTPFDDDSSDGLVYAVPAVTAVRVARDMVDHGQSSQVSLGIEVVLDPAPTDGLSPDVSTATSNLATTTEKPHTAGRHAIEVSGLTSGGPAERAGVETGDLLSSVGRCPTPDLIHLAGCLLRFDDRARVVLEVIRDGRPHDVDAVLRTPDVR